MCVKWITYELDIDPWWLNLKIVFSTYQIENKILAAAAEGNLLFINTSAYHPLVPTVQNKVRLLTMALDTCHVVHTLTVMSTRV